MPLDTRANSPNGWKIVLLAFLLLLGGTFAYAAGTSGVSLIDRSENSSPEIAEVKRLSGTGHENWGPYDNIPNFPNRPFSRAKIVYRSDSGSGERYPKYRTWNGSGWSSESEAPPVNDNLLWVESEHCPPSVRPEEWIFAATDNSNYLNYYVWNGESWSENEVLVDNGNLKAFDVTYERTSGDAVLVYSKGTVDPELYYRIWDGESWSAEGNLDFAESGKIDFLRMASRPDPRDEIVLVAVNSNPTAFGAVWNGNSWENKIQFTPSGDAYESTTCSVDVAYEQNSLRALAVYNDASEGGVYSREWDPSSGWSSPQDTGLHLSNFNEISAQSKADTDNIMLVNVNENKRYERVLWNGESWMTLTLTEDNLASGVSRRNFDLVWSREDAVFACENVHDNSTISYQAWSPDAQDWGNWKKMNIDNEPCWFELEKNPRRVDGDNEFLGAYLEAGRMGDVITGVSLYGLRYDGSTLFRSSRLGTPQRENSEYLPRFRYFDLTYEQPSEDNGNIFLIKPAEGYSGGLWIQFELVNRAGILENYYFFTQRIGIYQASSTQDWDKNTNWRGPITTEKLRKFSKPLTFQIPAENVDYDRPLVVSLEDWYYRSRDESFLKPVHILNVEEGDY